jgi:hypothetical protein
MNPIETMFSVYDSQVLQATKPESEKKIIKETRAFFLKKNKENFGIDCLFLEDPYVVEFFR